MQVREYRTTLEKINLTLQEYIDHAFVMFGKSKSGMTSAAHYLTQSKLTGYKLNGEPKVEVEGHQFRQQKIGKSYSTQTLVPNKFQVKVKSMEQKIFLIDSTGFGNTHGSLGILSSGYAHLRIFQRVKSMKFILCFDQKDLFGDGMTFFETLRQFIEFFKDFDSIKHQIMQSCVFLFTKVTDQQNLKSHLTHFANQFKSQIQDEQQQRIKDFIHHIVEKDKIFYIKKAEVGQIIQSPTLMDQIDQKIQNWWTRGYIDNSSIDNMFSSIDMSSIKVSLTRQLPIACLSGVKSKNQSGELMQYYENINNWILKSQVENINNFTLLFNFLVDDFMSDSKQCKTFQAMINFIEQKTFNNTERELGFLLNKVKTEKINKIYKDTPRQSYNMEVNTMRLAVKKFQTLQKIENQSRKLSNMNYSNPIKPLFGQVLKSLEKIFSYLHQLALWYGKQLLVKTYFYELFQLMNQLRCLKLFINKQIQEQYEIFESINNGGPFPQQYVLSQIKLILGLGFEYQDQPYNCIEILELYIKRLNINQLQQTGYIIDEQFVQTMFNQYILHDLQCQPKLIQLIQTYSDMVLERMELQQKSEGRHHVNYPVIYTKRLKKQLLNNLYLGLQWSHQHYKLSCDNNQQRNKRLYTQKIKHLTANLANLLLYKHENNLAITLFTSVNMVSSVCSTYEKMIGNLENVPQQNKNISSIIYLKQSYVEYLIGHMRVGRAISILNQMLSDCMLSEQQLIEISGRLCEIRHKQFVDGKVQQYKKILVERRYFSPLDEQTREKIDEVIDNCISEDVRRVDGQQQMIENNVVNRRQDDQELDNIGAVVDVDDVHGVDLDAVDMDEVHWDVMDDDDL